MPVRLTPARKREVRRVLMQLDEEIGNALFPVGEAAEAAWQDIHSATDRAAEKIGGPTGRRLRSVLKRASAIAEERSATSVFKAAAWIARAAITTAKTMR